MTAVIPAAVAADENLDRIFGADRFLTAVEIALEGWEDGADVVVLANGLNFPDALAGVPLAAALDAPILLTGAAELNEDTAAAIEELEAEEVIILGGEAAVSKAVFEELKDMGLEVERVFGDGRWDTAVAIAEKLAEVLDVDEFETAVVVYARNFPDALAAASYAAINEMPIFLTDTDEVSEPTADALEAFNVEEVLVVGGKSVISDDVVEELGATRIAGDTREETSVALAEHFELETELYYMATGYNFADAIAGAALAAKEGTGILLVGQSLPKAVRDFLQTGKVMDVVVFGGTNAVATTVVNNVAKNLFDPSIINVEGVTELTKTHVSITFHPLSEDIEDAEIEVIDNKGNVIEVEPVNLVINETEATFEFVKALTADPEGVWVIEGYEYDVDTVSIIAAVNGATSELKLYNALIDGGFDNVKVANSPAYWAEFEGDFETLAEIQEFIDEVNASLITNEEEAELIEALDEAVGSGSRVLVLNALAPWARVNAAYVDDVTIDSVDYDGYFTVLDDVTDITALDFDDIQELIDGVNNEMAEEYLADALANATRTKYNAAVKALGFVKADDEEEEETYKADMQELLVELNLVIKVKEATTAAQFANAYNALVNYYDEDDTTIGVEPFFTALRLDYMVAVEDITTAAEIEAAIVEVNDAKRASLYNSLADITGETATATVLARLQAFAAYVDEDDFDIADVHTSTSRLERYRTNLALLVRLDAAEGAPADLETAIGLVDAAISNANDAAVQAPLDAIAGYEGEDAAAFLVLLKNAELALGNVVNANAEIYVVEMDAIQTAAALEEGARAAVKAVVEGINQVQIIANATTAAGARDALGYVAITEEVNAYINLTAAQKTEIASLFITDAKWGTTKFVGSAREVANLKSYTDIDNVVTDLGKLITKYGSVLTGVNEATAINVMVTELGALDYKAYNDLNAAQRIDVADYVIENFPMTTGDEPTRIEFKTLAAIQALVDAAIAATK
jgi:putative cell wall-binding protein